MAVITGASRGIGRAIALAFAREGADICIAARSASASADSPGTIHSVAEEVEHLGATALPVKMDLRSEQDIQVMVDTVVTKLGGIDILVNNVAVFPMYHMPLVDFPVEYWDLTMNVNLRGLFLCTKMVLPYMIKKCGGSVINISSMAAVRAGKRRIAYGVSKAGVERLTFGLSDEVKEYNIAVNALSPVGLTDTRAARELFPEHDPKTWVKPDDIARAAVWLALQNAGTFTGRAVAVAPGGNALSIYGISNSEQMWFRID